MHPIRRKVLIALFAIGTVAGYGSGFAHLRCCHRARQQAWEQHVARVCVDAARRSQGAPGQDTPARGFPGGDW